MFTIVKTALLSIWRNKLTSFLAVLGVVIGVSSVSILISVGQGLKKDMSSLIQGMGTNVIAVIAGKMDTSNPQAKNQSNPANFIAGDILTIDDVNAIKNILDIEAVSPLTLVTGEINYNGQKTAPTITGVYPDILQAMQIIKISQGQMFTALSAKEIVLGEKPSKSIFGDENPIGKIVKIGKDDFKVVGVLALTKSSSALATDVDTLALIPFDTATKLNKNQVKILRIVAKAKNDSDVKKVKEQIKTKILALHGGDENFTVFTQEDILDLFSQFLNMATALVSAIAAISIVVGGIGIMNIMLVTVTERTREIGIRKAVGATNFSILLQFLVEAMVITFIGGLIGLLVTLAASIAIQANTPLKPDVSYMVLILAFGISAVVGVIFGLIPALRAARKDPIDALRYE